MEGFQVGVGLMGSERERERERGGGLHCAPKRVGSEVGVFF